MIYESLIIFVVFGAMAIGALLGYALKQKLSKKKLESSENLAARIIDEAKKEAETIKKEAVLQAKENLLKTKTEFEKDTKERKIELDNLERRLRSKEENIDRRIDLLSQKEANNENKGAAEKRKTRQVKPYACGAEGKTGEDCRHILRGSKKLSHPIYGSCSKTRSGYDYKKNRGRS